MKNELKKLIGTLPDENDSLKRIRFHQGWWRAFVMAEKEGQNPVRKEEAVCNTILNGESNSQKNFLSEKIKEAIKQTKKERLEYAAGNIDWNRVYNNLLSSQPLCFNFFGEFKADTDFAMQVLQQFWPELIKVNWVKFEFAPKENYAADHSAFDVAFEVMTDNQRGLIGLECKYTDTFSQKVYGKNKTDYQNIFNQSKEKIFIKSYEDYITPRFNQLFRNQLIAEALVQKKQYRFVYTGLFCHQSDKSALETGEEFQSMLKNGDKVFRIIKYSDFIEKMQRLELSWEQREFSMMLWARYCGLVLSEETFS